MRNLNAQLFFPTRCKITLLDGGMWGLRMLTALLTSWQGQFGTQFVMEPGGWGYRYTHVQIVVKSNLSKIDLLSLSVACCVLIRNLWGHGMQGQVPPQEEA